MMKLMAGVPLDTEKDEEPAELTENDLTKTVEQLKKKFEGEFEKKTEAILDGLNKYIELLEKASEKQYLFSSQVEYQFSPDLHHSGVSIISDILAKSTGNVHINGRGIQLSLRIDAAMPPEQESPDCRLQNKVKHQQLVSCGYLP
jgi:hypothetical protein